MFDDQEMPQAGDVLALVALTLFVGCVLMWCAIAGTACG